MAKETAKKKFKKVMTEFKDKKLHSGSKKGPKVTNPKQAVAIAYSEQSKADESKGAKKAAKKKKKPEHLKNFKARIAKHLHEDIGEYKEGIADDVKELKRMKKGK